MTHSRDTLLSTDLIHIRPDFLHPLTLFHIEWTSAVAMAAADAIVCILFQRAVMHCRHAVSGLCQIIILVHLANVDANRTRLAVIAVNTLSERFRRGKGTDHGIVRRILGLVVIRQ